MGRIIPVSVTVILAGLLVLACGGTTEKYGDDSTSDTGHDSPDTRDSGPDTSDVPPDDTDVEVPPGDCGNGILEGWEECDDGNTDAGDGCAPDCTIEQPPNCGDCVVDYDEMEQCDDCNTADGDGCSSTCQREQPPHCGDGILDISQGEQCDDGNTVAGDGCSPTCQYEGVGAACGDSVPDPGEVCDDGNGVNGDNCNPTCNLTNTTELFVGSPGAGGLLDGVGTLARIGSFGTLTADADYLYFGDGENHVVRRIEISSAVLETMAGDEASGSTGHVDDPVGANARFDWVGAVATDGNTLWVADLARIRAVDLAFPFPVTTVAGSGTQNHADGTGTAAEFDDLRGLTYYDGMVYLLDGASATLRSFDPATNDVVTLAGQPYVLGTTDGVGMAARFQSPRYMCSDNSGMLYIADTNGNKIRAYNTMTDEVTTFAGDGTSGYLDSIGTSALIHRPRGMTSDGTSIYWTEFNQHTIRQGILATQAVSTLVGTHCGGVMPCTGGYNEGIGTAALFDGPFSIVFHYPTNSLYVHDGANYVIRRIY
jgi:cysteine-rich repeat protein